MHFIGRRNFLAGLGLGAAAPLLTPLCRRLLREAQGAPGDERRVIFYTHNQGWNNEADDRNVKGPGYKPGTNSVMFGSNVRSATDWDLPTMFEPLKSSAKDMTILFGFHNFMSASGAPHGSGNATLTAARPTNEDAEGPPQGISIDRFLGAELKKRHGDAIDSTNMATIIYGQYPSSTSADGKGRSADAYTTPVKAYAAYFGNVMDATPGQVDQTLALEKSLLDRMTKDIERVRTNLAGFEREKLDQALESVRSIEMKFSRQMDPKLLMKPPAPTSNSGALEPAVIAAYVDLTVSAQVLGLTHASHIAAHGYNTESDSRAAIYPGVREGDTHNYVYHGDKGRYANIEDREVDIRAINKWHAQQVANMRSKLTAAGLAENTLIVWMNPGGYMHHRGHHNHPVVLIGGLGGKIKTPVWMDMTEYVSGQLYRLRGKRFVGDAFVTIANAMGFPITTFGEASLCKGPVSEILG